MRQSEALGIMEAGANVFLTGAPGAGKTYTLNEFIHHARTHGTSVAVTASTGIAATHINGQTIHAWSGAGVATALTDQLIKLIRSRRRTKSVAVTASTGIAATHINGQTIHAWSGAGVATALTDQLIKLIRSRRRTKLNAADVLVIDEVSMMHGQTIHAWSGAGVATALTDQLIKLIRSRRRTKLNAADVLVIDEVSMMHAWLFDMVDQICRIVRRDSRPFGGLQVVCSGDFFQLPPVSVSSRNHDVITPSPEYLASRERYARAGRNPEGFITESFAWSELDPVICYLDEQHRQDDGQLLRVLTDIRQGCVSQQDRDVLVTRRATTT